MTKAQLIAAVRAMGMTCSYNTDTREYRVNYAGGAEATACYDTDRDSILATAKAMKVQRAEFDRRVENFNEIRVALRHAQRLLRAESRKQGDTLGNTDAETIEALILSMTDEFNSKANAPTSKE